MKLTDYSEENRKIRQMNLQELKKTIENCEKCKLSENRTNAVPGSGNEDADILLIGEGPGEKEDLQGEPFVGKAGEKLDRYLEKAGIDREEIFISNVVKCRPPDNRDPHKDELESCHPYTKRLIELIDPVTVGLLGRVPTKQLTGKKSITRVRGKKIEKKGRIYIPTFHPAALIYDPSKEEDLIKDLRTLKECSD